MPETITKTIRSYERLRLSTNGNPRFRFTFEDGTILDSSSDASWCYAVGNRGMCEGSAVDMTLTRAGKIRTMSEVIRSTARTANGRDLERHERQARRL